MFWCVFLKGLCIWKKNRIYFILNLIFIFYTKLPETGVFFVFIRSQSLGEPMLKMYIWMLNVGGGMYPVSLCLFLCVKKKRCKWRSWRNPPRGLLQGKNFFVSAKSHEAVHGHARPKLPRRTMLNPSKLSEGSIIPAVWSKLKANFIFCLVQNQKYYLSTLSYWYYQLS